jgi:hypothetical protein
MRFEAGTPSYERTLIDEVRKLKARKRRAAQRRKVKLAGRPEDSILVRAKPGPKVKRPFCKDTTCDRQHYGKGFCEMHYRRDRRRQGKE